MNRKGFAPIIILLVIAGILIIGGAYYYAIHKQTTASGQAVPPPPTSTTSSSSGTSLPPVATSTNSSATSNASTSSSTAQVGAFTVVTNCVMDQQAGGNIITQINIFKGNTLTQTIPARFDTEIYACQKVQSQDINFDGYPDIMLNTGHGATGNENYNFWIYSTSTGQFGCPYKAAYGADACTLGGDKYPVFNTASDTIATHWNDGCAGACTTSETFQIINGQMVLIKDVTVEPASFTQNSPLIQTTKEIINGVPVVTTSTVSYP